MNSSSTAAAAVLLLAGCQLPGDNSPPPPVNSTSGLAGAPANGAGSAVGGGLLPAGCGWAAAGIVGGDPAGGKLSSAVHSGRGVAAGSAVHTRRRRRGGDAAEPTRHRVRQRWLHPHSAPTAGGHRRGEKESARRLQHFSKPHPRIRTGPFAGLVGRRIHRGAAPFSANKHFEDRYRVGLRPQRQGSG